MARKEVRPAAANGPGVQSVDELGSTVNATSVPQVYHHIRQRRRCPACGAARILDFQRAQALIAERAARLAYHREGIALARAFAAAERAEGGRR